MSSLELLQQKDRRAAYLAPEPGLRSCKNGFAGQASCVDEMHRLLSPVSDALHLVHGPSACSACSWAHPGADLLAALRAERLSFSTDLKSSEMNQGGKKKLYRSLTQLIYSYAPKIAFVYPSCQLSADRKDIAAVCRRVEKENGVSVFALIPQHETPPEQKAGATVCDALFTLVEQGDPKAVSQYSINILGELGSGGGDAWTFKRYYEQMGVQVVAVITGDAKLTDIQRARGATLNVLHCPESFLPLAEKMRERFGIPYIRESFFGLENSSKALYDVGQFFSGKAMILHRAQSLVKDEMNFVSPVLQGYTRSLEGKNAGIYLKNSFMASSLAEALQSFGMNVVAAGVKDGNSRAYEALEAVCEDAALLKNMLSPSELSTILLHRQTDLFIGEAQEQRIMQKLGIACCNSLHESRLPLLGYRGMLNLARDLYSTIVSPVWELTPRRRKQRVHSVLPPQSTSKRYQTA